MNKEILNEFYALLDFWNDYLLNKSQTSHRNNKNAIIDALYFHIITNMQSTVKNILLDNVSSLGSVFNLRSILESSALLKKVTEIGLSDVRCGLFPIQFKIQEYHLYRKFKQCDDILFDLDVIEKDYRDAEISFNEVFKDYNAKERRKAKDSQVPFLGKDFTGFEDLITDTIPELRKTYKYLSQAIHPHYPGMLISDNYFMNTLFKPIYVYVNVLILHMSNVYGIKASKNMPSFDKRFELYTSSNNTTGNTFYTSYNKQADILLSIAKTFNTIDENNVTSKAFIELRKILLDVNSDKLFGQSEHGKMKFKLLLEMFGTFYYTIYGQNRKTGPLQEELLLLHTQLKTNDNLSIKQNDKHEIIVRAFSIFSKFKSHNLTFSDFEKGFVQPLGFLIDEYGKVMSLTKLSYSVIDKFIHSKINDIALSDLMKLSYKEGQLMSHGTGYLYYANAAAFKEEENILMVLDQLIYFFIGLLHDSFKQARKQNPDANSKKLVNILRNSAKKYLLCIREKNTCFQVQGQNKSRIDFLMKQN